MQQFLRAHPVQVLSQGRPSMNGGRHDSPHCPDLASLSRPDHRWEHAYRRPGDHAGRGSGGPRSGAVPDSAALRGSTTSPARRHPNGRHSGRRHAYVRASRVSVERGPATGGDTGRRGDDRGHHRHRARAHPCNNAGDLPRVFSLYTDDLVRTAFGGDPAAATEVAARFATPPAALPAEARTTLSAIRGVRLLSDGRAGAVVVDEDPARTTVVFLVFEQVGDRWLVDGQIAIEPGAVGTPEAGTPAA